MTWTDADIAADSGAAWDDADIAPSSPLDNPRWGMGGYDAGMGFLKGATTLGASIPQGIMSAGEAILAGEGQEGARRRYEERRANLNQSFADLADTEGLPFKAGQFGGEIAATAGLGPAQKATPVGAAALEGTARLGRYLANTARGGISGGMQAAAINPDDAALGAGLGAAIPAVLQPMAKAGVNAVGMFTDKIRGDLAAIRAGKMLRDIAGGATDDILRATEANPNLLPGQAAMGAGVQRNPFYALQEMFRGDDAITATRNAQEVAALRQAEALTGGASSAAESELMRAQGRGAVESALGPEREFLLDVANVGKNAGNLRSQAQQLMNQFNKVQNVAGAPMGAGYQLKQQADILLKQADDIERAGFTPLDVSNVFNNVRTTLSDPALGASGNVTDVLSDVARQIKSWVGKGGGTIDARALYTKRKTAVNETVAKLLAGTEPAASKRLAAQLSGQVRDAIDDSLEASAPGWKALLSKYSDQLQELDRNELVSTARGLLKRKDMKGFINLVRNESPETVQKIIMGATTMEQALPAMRSAGPSNQLNTLQNIASGGERDLAVTEAAQLGSRELDQIIKDSSMSGRIPNLFSPKITVTNAILDKVEHNLNRDALDQVKIAMRSGADANRILKMFPLNQRNEAAKWIAMGGPARLMTKGVGAVTASPER